MVHSDPDFPTKKALKEAVAAGKKVYVYSPGMFPAPQNGKTVIEGPARMHKWYAMVVVKDGYVVKVLS
jgi:hypothetical protein